jgi:hypothetical protein
VLPGSVADALLVSAIAIVVLAPLLRRALRRNLDVFAPIVFFAAAYGVMFVVRPAAMLTTDALVHEGPRRTIDVSSTFTEMLWLALLGAVSFVVAYEFLERAYANKRPLATSPAHELDAHRLAVVAAVIGGAAVLTFILFLLGTSGTDAFANFFQRGNLDDPSRGASYYARSFFLAAIPSTLVLLYVALQKSAPWVIAAAVAIGGIFLAHGVATGDRSGLLPLLGGALVLVYVVRRKRPRVATIVAIALLALVASTFLSDLRGRATRDESVVESALRSATPSRLVDSVATGPDSEMAATLPLALMAIPEDIDNTYGKTIFGDMIVRPIPRYFWDDKPQPPRTKLIAHIWPIEYQRGTINVEFSALLYFYWDFGAAGIAVGLAVYGALAYFLYNYYRRRDGDAFAQLLLSLGVWFVVVALRDSPVDTLVRLVFTVAPLWLIFALARGSRKHRFSGGSQEGASA